MSDVLTTEDLLQESAGAQLPMTDGELLWWPRIDLGQRSDLILRDLVDSCAWRQEEIKVYGKAYRQPRLSAWYGDLGYSYSGIRLEPMPCSPLLLDIKARVQRLVGHEFNSVLLNYYRDQHDKMGMHSDDERELGPQPVIASLSIGETRRLLFRHKTRKDLQTVKLELPDASLLLMRGDTQRYWRHGINAERNHCGARVNLTFRSIIPQAQPARGAAQPNTG
jgi:alkylated DNA repair dioxygenase AlkB